MFAGISTKILLYAVGVLLIIAAVLGAVWKFNSWLDKREQAIRQSMRDQFTIEQQKVIQAKQDEFLKQVITLQKTAETMQFELAKKEQQLDILADEIARQANAVPGADDPAAPYLREIVGGLRKSFQ